MLTKEFFLLETKKKCGMDVVQFSIGDFYGGCVDCWVGLVA